MVDGLRAGYGLKTWRAACAFTRSAASRTRDLTRSLNNVRTVLPQIDRRILLRPAPATVDDAPCGYSGRHCAKRAVLQHRRSIRRSDDRVRPGSAEYGRRFLCAWTAAFARNAPCQANENHWRLANDTIFNSSSCALNAGGITQESSPPGVCGTSFATGSCTQHEQFDPLLAHSSLVPSNVFEREIAFPPTTFHRE